ncbi:HesA/MoeB/ThiF family protein [Aliivibrio kagoshimensis]|uniref:HesA/MoeB/ThiF family protein n=1 Tax=Aliivibrio kagoshimensis TaxID=2910230 RepID=UPI003D1090D8
METLTDCEFVQYSRQIMLPEVEECGQLKLKSSSVLIIGMGGLGSAASSYLAASGVGTIVIADHDEVDVSNLQRQTIYRYGDVNSEKVLAAKKQLEQINGNIRIRTVNKQLSGDQLSLEVSLADVVLDCTDNLKSRYAINEACISNKKVLISGAAIGWKGQLMTFDFTKQMKGCYGCLFPKSSEASESINCSTYGIIGPVVGIIGNMQALEAIKVISNITPLHLGNFYQFDGISNQWITLQIQQDSECPTCTDEHCDKE